MDYNHLTALAISLGLGLIVGFQRERANSVLAGIRTFPLITLLGTLTGILAQSLESPWLIAGALLGVTGMVISANMMHKPEDNEGIGLTTEVAILLMFSIGVFLVYGDRIIGVMLTAVAALLLHSKAWLNPLVDRTSEKDVKAIMQFVAISMVILPLVPNEAFGPYEVINPHNVWLMVVLIVGLSLSGYFAYKWLGKDVGTLASGILGGLISSTATTVTYARRTSDVADAARLAAFIITTASAIAVVRVLVEMSAVVPQHFSQFAPPLLLEFVIMAAICAGLYFYKGKEEDAGEVPEPKNPAQFKTAIVFALLYAVILVGVEAAQDYFGQNGLYIVSIISGFTDVDAITLSIANILKRGGIEAGNAWRLVLLATLSNLLFKGGLALSLGHARLRPYILLAFSIAITSGLLIIWLWPN